MILHPPSEWPYEVPYQTDLLHFFALYGIEIRKLSLGGRISVKALQNLLSVHMPSLTCLDIDDLSDIFSDHDTPNRNSEENSMQVCFPLPSTLKIKQIFVGTRLFFSAKQAEFLKDLISVCPNLRAIERSGEAALEILIEMEKYPLIKELTYGARLCQAQVREQVSKLVKDTILKKKLQNFQLNQYHVFLCDILGYGLEWMAINIILSASKNSLKVLKSLSSSTKILNLFVPRLPYLEYLELSDRCNGRPAGVQFKFVDVIGRAIKSSELTTNKVVSEDDFKTLALQTQGLNNIPADYFPRLRKVRLASLNLIKDPTKLLGFFSLEHHGPDGVTTVPGDTLPTVTTLEFGRIPCDVGYIPKLFPNVSKLIFYCNSSKDFGNWVWTAFPKLERLEITSNNFDNNWDAETVDCFFTGISQESREHCYGKSKSSKLGFAGTKNEKNFERTQPYIGDCENVKKFKIQFWGKCGWQFASAAVYGLENVTHRTKIILSLLSDMDPEMSLENMIETLQKLNPVTAYVEIRMNK